MTRLMSTFSSRAHGRCVYDIDLGSGNGTKVNGTRVTEMVLGQSAHIAIGTTVLQFGFAGSESRAPVDKVVDVRTTSTALRAGLIILGLVVVLGAVWMVVNRKFWRLLPPAVPTASRQPEKVEVREESQAVVMADKVREFLSRQQLLEAAGMIEALENGGGDPQLVSNLRSRLVAAQQHRSLIASEKQRLMTGDAEEVIIIHEVIPTTSPFYTEADELRDKAQQILVEGLKESAYDHQTEASAQARAVLNRVLKINPDDGEAALLVALINRQSQPKLLRRYRILQRMDLAALQGRKVVAHLQEAHRVHRHQPDSAGGFYAAE